MNIQATRVTESGHVEVKLTEGSRVHRCTIEVGADVEATLATLNDNIGRQLKADPIKSDDWQSVRGECEKAWTKEVRSSWSIEMRSGTPQALASKDA